MGEACLCAPTFSAILKEEPKPVGALVADVPRDLERIISRCLRKDPDRRFQHMGDVKVALEELKEESESGKLTSIGPPLTPGRKKSRWVWTVAGSASCSLWSRRLELGSFGRPVTYTITLSKVEEFARFGAVKGPRDLLRKEYPTVMSESPGLPSRLHRILYRRLRRCPNSER